MAIQIQGNSGTVAEVDGPTFRALRVTPRPADYGSLGHYRISINSGTMAASLASGSEIFQARWNENVALCVIYEFVISAGMNVAATAAAITSFELWIARTWTVVGSGGTAASLTGNNQKMRSSMGTSLFASTGDIRASSTAALGVGTKSLDAQAISGVAIGILTGAITVQVSGNFLPRTNLIDIDGGVKHPIVLAQAEGIALKNTNAMPATMTWAFEACMAWAELASY